MRKKENALQFFLKNKINDPLLSEDLSFVMQPLMMMVRLSNAGFDDEIISAALLYDIYNNGYSPLDISKLFGGRVSSLILTSMEPDKSLDFYESKKQLLKALNGLPDSNKAIICAKKLTEMELLDIKGVDDSLTDTQLKNYYQDIFDSLCIDAYDPKLIAILEEYYDVFMKTFGDFNINFNSHYSKSSRNDPNRVFNGYQSELVSLKKLVKEEHKPYLIEFVKIPKEERSTIVDLIRGFINKSDFRLKVQKSFDDFLNNYRALSDVERHLFISVALKSNLFEDAIGDKSIMMCSETMFECLMMFKMLIDSGRIKESDFFDYVYYYYSELEKLVNHSVVCYTDPIESINSKYASDDYPSIIKSQKSVDDYNKLLIEFSILLNGGVIDETKFNNSDVTLCLANFFLPIMQEEYIKKLKRYIETKKVA